MARQDRTIAASGCRVSVGRVEGPHAREVHLLARPTESSLEPARQAEAAYRAILETLQAEGGDARSLVSEQCFLRDLRADAAAVRRARASSLGGVGEQGAWRGPPQLEIEQPPLEPGLALEVAVQAVIPRMGPLDADWVGLEGSAEWAVSERPGGLRVRLGEEERFYAAGLCGRGEDAFEEARSLFFVARDLLLAAGLGFRDVVRTWIHLREMDRDYDALNRARRAFFVEEGIDPPPASTGIGGGPAVAGRDLCLGFYAVRPAADRRVMTSPTLNEAPEYGADFTRGMRVHERNRIALHVSGTASIDEGGRTAHPDDLGAQVDRMLANVEALLREQGAGPDDVVSAITYLKRPADAGVLREKLQQARFAGFPHALVEAPICRPELLCETEAFAVLPAMESDPARE